MKLKKMWYVFIPTLLLITITKIYEKVAEFSEITLLGKDRYYCVYTIIVLTFLMFVVLSIIGATDKKTAPVYNIRKNTPAGTMCLLAAAVIVVDLGVYVPEVILYEGFSKLTILNIISYSFASIGMFIFSWAYISGKKPKAFCSFLLLAIPCYGGVRLLDLLVDNSTLSVMNTDVVKFLSYVFLTMFMLSAVSVVCGEKGRNPVKSSMIFGLIFVTLVFVNTIQSAFYFVINGFVAGLYAEFINTLELLLFGLYAFFLIKELTQNAYSLDKITIADNNKRKNRKN